MKIEAWGWKNGEGPQLRIETETEAERLLLVSMQSTNNELTASISDQPGNHNVFYLTGSVQVD